MCVATAFEEEDPDPSGHYGIFRRGLSKALKAVSNELGKHVWCANPFLEGFFPRSNCLACHQNAGALFGFQFLEKSRNNFPADFAFSFMRFRIEIANQLDPEE